MNKQNILIVSDTLFAYTGVSNQVKHICKKLVKAGHKVISLGPNQSSANKIQEYTYDTGETVKCYASKVHNGQPVFDDMQQISSIIFAESITAVILFTDPHRYLGIWNNANFFHTHKIPLIYVSVWDTYLVNQADGTPHFNRPIYECCDVIACISKQTEWFTNKVLENLPANYIKPHVMYCGHGSNPDVYKPLPKEELTEIKKRVLGDKEYDFVALMVNKNQHRKRIPDLIEAWREFYKALPEDKRTRTTLILHCDPVSPVGFDLPKVIAGIAPNCDIKLSSGAATEVELNKLYNLADVVINVSNAEGFGLCTNEAMLVGKPILVNATGGLVDQIGFFDAAGLPVKWSLEFRNNLHDYRSGQWAKWLPNERHVVGSPITHYLYDEYCSIESIMHGLNHWYYMPANYRKEYGLIGRDYCLSTGLNSKGFSNNVLMAVEYAVKNYQERPAFNVYPV